MCERAPRQSRRDSRIVPRALAAVMNPTEDGALPRTMATLQLLQHWRYIHAGILQKTMGKLSALLGVVVRQQLGTDSALGNNQYTCSGGGERIGGYQSKRCGIRQHKDVTLCY